MTNSQSQSGVHRAWRTVALGLAAGVVAYAVLNRNGWRPPPPPGVPDPVRQLSPSPLPDDPWLDQPLAAMDLDRVRLDDAVARVARAAGLTVACDWADVAGGGPAGEALRATPVTLHLRGNTVAEALDRVLAVPAADVSLGWVHADDLVTVCTAARAATAACVTRVYDVRPILAAAAAGVAVFGPGPPQSSGGQGQFVFVPGVTPTTPESALMDELKEFIQAQVDPNSWKDNGGEMGSMSSGMGRLVVTQTPQAHRQVERALATLYPKPAAGGR